MLLQSSDLAQQSPAAHWDSSAVSAQGISKRRGGGRGLFSNYHTSRVIQQPKAKAFQHEKGVNLLLDRLCVHCGKYFAANCSVSPSTSYAPCLNGVEGLTLQFAAEVTDIISIAL